MPIRLVSVALSILTLAFSAAPGQAQQTQNDLRDSARLIGSERLRTFTLARGLDPGAAGIGVAQDLKSLLIDQGFYLEEGSTAVLLKRHALYPLLSYVPNLNGGLENTTLKVGGLTFELNEDQVARGGLALGGGYDGSLRLGWSQGRYIEARYQAESIYAPGIKLLQTEDRAALCARNHVTGWTFADLCLRQSRIWQDLNDSNRREAEFSMAHLFEAIGRTHEVTVSAGRGFGAGSLDSFLSLGLESASRNMATRLLLRIGTPSPDGTGANVSLLSELRWNMKGRIAGLSLSASRSSEVPFLGLQRQDVTIGIGGLLQLNDSAVLSATWRSNQSTVDFFDTESIKVEVSFKLR